TAGHVLYVDSLISGWKVQPKKINPKLGRQTGVSNIGKCGSYLYNDTVNTLLSGADTIKGYYCAPDIKCKPRYCINYVKAKILSDGSNEAQAVRLLNGTFYEGDRLLRMTVMYEAQPFKKYMNQTRPVAVLPIYYDKCTSESFVLPFYEKLCGYAFKNDVDGGLPFAIHMMIGNKLYQLVDAERFIELAQDCKSEKVKEIASQLTYDSNPVVIIATLK
ncbi:MAG: hypothetical protein IKU18_03220, partial [Bacteroidales bacterium]|nr:hypothetical protein [Bacteroidales bacterium]